MSSNPMPPRDGDLRALLVEAREFINAHCEWEDMPVPPNHLQARIDAALASPQEAQPLSQQREVQEHEGDTRVDGVPEGAHGDLPRHTTR
jgi:hypothetical protein